jgi:hypothetical protein
VRLCLSGPLLYIGLLMAVEPASLGRSAEALAHVLRTFEQRLKGVQCQEPLPESGSVYCSPAVLKAVRLSGLILIAFAFLHLAGLAT